MSTDGHGPAATRVQHTAVPLNKDGTVRFGLLLTSVHDRSVPVRQQIAEHHELISVGVDHGFDLVVAGQHFAAPTLRYLQPIPYLTSIAMRFPTVSVATGILLLPLHHPLNIAEEVATMDAVTGGRAIMGVGIGYSQDEFDAFGIDRTTRTERFEESAEVIRALWTGQPLTHNGRFYQFDNVEVSTLPVQQPHPPIWVGARLRRRCAVPPGWATPGTPRPSRLIGSSSTSTSLIWPNEQPTATGRSPPSRSAGRSTSPTAPPRPKRRSRRGPRRAMARIARGGSSSMTDSAEATGWTTGSCWAALPRWPRARPSHGPGGAFALHLQTAVARIRPRPCHGATRAVRLRGNPAIVRLTPHPSSITESRVYGIGQLVLPRSADRPLSAL